ncbi:hypothetical protein HMPREF1982_01760 [Clostridiales bacterium oral taxon 876 str. F0540]|nr:hypothetical protein HMPREF1982_01760 [Clostridiales bacterium oral taxon 876 str. F0540]
MEKLKKQQLMEMEKWIYENARPLEMAKWNLLWDKGSKDEVLKEMLKYQNADGGFGNAFESDMLLPKSSAIASTEAIFTSFSFDLDVTDKWFLDLLDYFMKTKQNTPSYWEAVPKEVEDYPRAPWWNYSPDTEFSPNPCAVVAAAMLLYGNNEQKALGNKIAEKCISLLKSDKAIGDHDIYCIQKLFIVLKKTGSELLNEETYKAMNRRILSNVCLKPEEYMNYVAQPLDFIDSPESPWYSLLKENVPMNAEFWINNISEEGVWVPNFSWGVDTPESKNATKNWKGYMAVKRVRILKAFGLTEKF